MWKLPRKPTTKLPKRLMEPEGPVCRFIAVYEDHWEIREGTSDDMAEIVYESCDDLFRNDYITETVLPGVCMLHQCEISEAAEAKHEAFENPFARAFGRFAENMNFVLFGASDDYRDNWFIYFRTWKYRSLTDEEIAQCLRLLESVTLPERKVFLGGSQTWTVLPEEVKGSLDCWMRRHIAFLVGDGKGADQLMQQYLHEKGYEKVTVFVSGDEVRCNEGGWNVVHCDSFARSRSDEFYSAKDIRMAETADEAFLLWDGESLGTRESIIRMRQLGKEVTVCRELAGWCWEERCTDWHSSLSDEKLQDELKRYSEEESRVIRAATRRCPEAAKELQLKKDEVFMLERLLPDGSSESGAPSFRPFLSFADALAQIGDEMVTRDPALPKPHYVLEKWAAKGDFNRTFFRFRDELIEVDPPDEDYHMELTARFELEGDEVVSLRLINRGKEKK